VLCDWVLALLRDYSASHKGLTGVQVGLHWLTYTCKEQCLSLLCLCHLPVANRCLLSSAIGNASSTLTWQKGAGMPAW
jgi:hypothetical protein